MRVLVIMEDPARDQHVVRPVVERIFRDLARGARIDVLTDPHLRGAAQALDGKTIAAIVEDHPMADLFLLVVDRDCNRQRNAEKAAAREAEQGGKLIATLACEEVEVWALALHRRRLGVPWREVRRECDPKETYFDPFIAEQGWVETVGRGRKRAMRCLGKGWRGLLSACPEVKSLRDRVRVWLATR